MSCCSADKSVFATTALIPAANVSSGWIASAYNVHKIIGAFTDIARRVRATSSPFMRGIDKSSTIRSGLKHCALSMASSPSVASAQTEYSACFSKKWRVAVRIAWLSSAMSMHFGIVASSLGDSQKAGSTLGRKPYQASGRKSNRVLWVARCRSAVQPVVGRQGEVPHKRYSTVAYIEAVSRI
jgi:hypothetical protein